MVVNPTVRTSRFVVNASHTMETISITAVNEINEPMDEIIFHVVYAIRIVRISSCIPERPRTCCGKKVMFTPTNIIMK